MRYHVIITNAPPIIPGITPPMNKIGHRTFELHGLNGLFAYFLLSVVDRLRKDEVKEYSHNRCKCNSAEGEHEFLSDVELQESSADSNHEDYRGDREVPLVLVINSAFYDRPQSA